MSPIKRELVVAAIFTASITLFFVYLIPTWYTVHKDFWSKSEPYNQLNINWEDEYPFEELAKENNVNEYELEGLKTHYLSIISQIETSISSVVTNGTLARYPLSEFYCKIQKMMGLKRFESEDGPVLLLEDGVLSTQSKIENSKNNNEIVKRLGEFHQWLASQGIQYLYVLAPCKTSPVNDDNTYDGYVDYQKYNMEYLAESMEESGIPFVNLQEEASKMGDVNNLFYKTDHHWKPLTALWGAYQLADNLNKAYGYKINLEQYDTSKYFAKDYGNRFLGSQGEKVTLGVVEPDDFQLVLPAFDTKLHVIINEIGIDKVGTFEETLIDYYRLEEENYPYNYYWGIEYASYGYGNQPVITIVNDQATNDLKVLILRDSFANSTGPYLSLGVNTVSCVDLRYFTGSVRSYIREFQPDVVITMLNGGSWDLDENYEYHTNILDYR